MHIVIVGAGQAGVTCAVRLETDGERIFAIRSVVNPDKLARL